MNDEDDATFVNHSTAWTVAHNRNKKFVTVGNRAIKISPSLIALVSALAVVLVGFCYSGISVYRGHAHKATATKPKVVKVINRQHVHIKPATPKQKHGFINQIGYPAVQAFKQDDYQVLPSIVIAQAIVESNWGTSGLYSEGHNIFGVKGAYRNKSVNMPTEEVVNGNKIHVNAYFRAYPNFEASILDHDQLLQNKFIGKSHDFNYHDVAYRIKAHAYATDPTYPQKLINTINTYHLYRYDKIGLQ